MSGNGRVVLKGTDPLEVCREVVARELHPEGVDVDTGEQILPLVLDDRHHMLAWIRLYSRCLAARTLFQAGAVDRCIWEIDVALISAKDAPCFLDEIYLVELRLLLRSAEQQILAGETGIEHYGPYVALTEAENLCVTQMIRREVHADRRRYPRT